MNTLDESALHHLSPEVKTWVERATQQLARQDHQLKNAQIKIEAMTLELAHLKRIQFGRKAEGLAPEQLSLLDEAVAEDIAAIEASTDALLPAEDRPARTPRTRAGRQPLPAHLPRIEHRHEPESCTCGQCGKDLIKIGEDISEQLDVEPAKFFVHRHIRPQYACRACESISAAPIPPAVIDGGLASVGLLTWVLIGKYLDHLPLYRLEQIAARSQVPLARSTLADWVGRLGVALQPLAERLRERLHQRPMLHADETPVQQLDPGKGKTKRAYLWAYRSGDYDDGPPIVVFDYQTDRSGKHAKTFLHDWQGALMVDDYAGYKGLFNDGVIELGCLAHARRKFYDLHSVNQSPIAAEALRRIQVLYDIEREGQSLCANDRHALRQQQAKPLLEDLHAWLKTTRLTTAPGSATTKALDYSLKRWTAIQRYLDDGTRPIDNNPIENTIRPIAIGKKNWLFTGSERAGKRAAAIQTLLATAKLNDLDPAAWLKEILEKLPTWPNSRIDELLPLRELY